MQGTSALSVADYYDKLASDYDEAVTAWGYCLPEATAEALAKYTDWDPNSHLTLLDLCCGNGLVGQVLAKRGRPFRNEIIGLDISQKSLELAQKRGCYAKLQKADLLQPLAFDANSFDFLLCIGATSYLGNFKRFSECFFKNCQNNFGARKSLNKVAFWSVTTRIINWLKAFLLCICRPSSSDKLAWSCQAWRQNLLFNQVVSTGPMGGGKRKARKRAEVEENLDAFERRWNSLPAIFAARWQHCM